MCEYLGFKTLSTLLTGTNTYANSVSPDETAHDELHYFSGCLWFWVNKTLLTTMDMTEYKDGRVKFRNTRENELNRVPCIEYFVVFWGYFAEKTCKIRRERNIDITGRNDNKIRYTTEKISLINTKIQWWNFASLFIQNAPVKILISMRESEYSLDTYVRR